MVPPILPLARFRQHSRRSGDTKARWNRSE